MFFPKDLINSINRGDAAAWKMVFMDYSDRLYRMAKLIVTHPGDAEDAVQETFRGAYERCAKKPYVSSDELSMYLFWKVKCHSLDMLRRKATHQKTKQAIEVFQEEHYIPETFKDEDQWVTGLKEAAVQYIKLLPPQQRRIISMIFWEQLDKKEVADRMQLSAVTIRNHFSRALVTLRQKLGIEHKKREIKWENTGRL